MIRVFVAALILGLIVLAGLSALPSRAQGAQCASVADALAALAARYHEHPRVSGLAANGAMMLVTASADGGFTVLMVSPDGTACMVATGTALELHAITAPGLDG